MDLELRRRKILIDIGAHPRKHLNPSFVFTKPDKLALLSTDFKSKALLKILISLQIAMNINDEKNYSTEGGKWASEIIWSNSVTLQTRNLRCKDIE